MPSSSSERQTWRCARRADVLDLGFDDMTRHSIDHLSDSDLLEDTRLAVACERRATARLLALLAEVDARKLYLGQGFASLFTYCTHVLHLSEPAAYSRITAARAARRFPVLLATLTDGEITLTTITLLAAHFTEENIERLIDDARHKSKRDVERLVACIHAQPDIRTTLRKLPDSPAVVPRTVGLLNSSTPAAAAPPTSIVMSPVAISKLVPASRRSTVAVVAAERYSLRVTLAGDTYRRLERARDLLRHQIPTGELGLVLDRALAVLVEQLEKQKHAATRRHRPARQATRNGRSVPAAVRRAVWARDQGRCAFVGALGRCHETGFLEFHHLQPFAAGGATTVANLQLRCRAHNMHEAQVYFRKGTLSGQS
jgi:hypothetical protein